MQLKWMSFHLAAGRLKHRNGDKQVRLNRREQLCLCPGAHGAPYDRGRFV